jgi:hypothetical protein
MSGNPLVRFDEGRVGRTERCRPLSYSTASALKMKCRVIAVVSINENSPFNAEARRRRGKRGEDMRGQPAIIQRRIFSQLLTAGACDLSPVRPHVGVFPG